MKPIDRLHQRVDTALLRRPVLHNLLVNVQVGNVAKDHHRGKVGRSFIGEVLYRTLGP